MSKFNNLKSWTFIHDFNFSCDDEDHDVLFLHNEKPLLIPGCQPKGLCKLSFLLERYSRFLNANCPEIYCTNEE